MPSFDVVCELNRHELINAIDQANREINNRFDFKESDASFILHTDSVELIAQNEFQIKQMVEILHIKFAKRQLDLGYLEEEHVTIQGKTAKQIFKLRNGIDGETARKIIKLIKEKKLKVQTAIQGDQVRVTGKKRDDLQEVISFLKEIDVTLPLQFSNFRE